MGFFNPLFKTIRRCWSRIPHLVGVFISIGLAFWTFFLLAEGLIEAFNWGWFETDKGLPPEFVMFMLRSSAAVFVVLFGTGMLRETLQRRTPTQLSLALTQKLPVDNNLKPIALAFLISLEIILPALLLMYLLWFAVPSALILVLATSNAALTLLVLEKSRRAPERKISFASRKREGEPNGQ